MQATCPAFDAAQQAFLSTVRRYAAMRTETPCYRFYEVWKRQARKDFPHLTGAEYDRLVGEIAKAAGI